MAFVDRTVYPQLPSTVSVRELAEAFTPTAEEVTWACAKVLGPGPRLALLVMLKASPTGELAYSTVASSCVITGCVTTPGGPDLGGDLGCGDGVIAQGVGDDGCWHVHDVLADGGRAGTAGGDAELAKVSGEAFGVHGLSRAAAGEQPLGVGVGGGVHVVSLVDPGEQELCEWGGDW